MELGTNDLSTLLPDVVGSKIDDLPQVLRDQYKVRIVGMCQVINRNFATIKFCDNICQFGLAVQPGIFVWDHKEFYRPDRSLLCLDGVHCNAPGKYCLYRSYRGAILKALTMLSPLETVT